MKKTLLTLFTALLLFGAAGSALASSEQNTIYFNFPQSIATEGSSTHTVTEGKVLYAGSKWFSSFQTEIDSTTPHASKTATLDASGAIQCWEVEVKVDGVWYENNEWLDDADTGDAGKNSSIIINVYHASNGDIMSNLTYTKQNGQQVTDDMGELRSDGGNGEPLE